MSTAKPRYSDRLKSKVGPNPAAAALLTNVFPAKTEETNKVDSVEVTKPDNPVVYKPTTKTENDITSDASTKVLSLRHSPDKANDSRDNIDTPPITSDFPTPEPTTRLFFYIEDSLLEALQDLKRQHGVKPADVANLAIERFLPTAQTTGVTKWTGEGKYAEHHLRVGWQLKTRLVERIWDLKETLNTDKSSIINNAVRNYLDRHR